MCDFLAYVPQLLLRDGHTSPISNYTDWDTHDTHLEFYDDNVGENRLVVAHIIPFSLNKRVRSHERPWILSTDSTASARRS